MSRKCLLNEDESDRQCTLSSHSVLYVPMLECCKFERLSVARSRQVKGSEEQIELFSDKSSKYMKRERKGGRFSRVTQWQYRTVT
jgi:hypothetical protein